MDVEKKPIFLHIVVVGFHHKLGCQVEFSYPPLIAGSSGKNECPSGWKYLPTLALPDGSHNFERDTVFFNLPSLLDPTSSVYGVSCYRQIPVGELKIRTADVTRSSVQKSVCILARLPIYGYIEVKLALIADDFFRNGDFSDTQLLVNAYNNYNACILRELPQQQQISRYHEGLALREIVLKWRHKVLILFKLFMLQRRVVCCCSPVREMCKLIVCIASLMPRLLEKGFREVACVRTSRPLSPMPDFTKSIQEETAAVLREQEWLAVSTGLQTQETHDVDAAAKGDDADNVGVSCQTTAANAPAAATAAPLHDANILATPERKASGERGSSIAVLREGSIEAASTDTLTQLALVNPDEYRAPVPIFASGNLLYPYMSLPYLDLLSDPSVESYVIGTSNVLFQQKQQLADVHVNVESMSIETHESDLRQQLVLSKEDLRFMDFMLKNVHAPKENAEGSEHWIREQFQGYMLALICTAVANNATTKDNDHFNAHFMSAFKKTQCFQEWLDVKPDDEFFHKLPLGHPFAGNLSISDIRLKIETLKDRTKINGAITAVGGAFTQAKGTLSGWISNMTAATTTTAADTRNLNDASDTSDAIAQEISVTFHNNGSDDNVVVKTNFATPNDGGNKQLTAGGGGTNEIEVGKIASNLFGTNATAAAAAATQLPPAEYSSTLSSDGKEVKGIVEIGREAATLDNAVQHEKHIQSSSDNITLDVTIDEQPMQLQPPEQTANVESDVFTV